MYKLVIQDDEGKTTVVPLIRDEITIGRKEGNTIRLTERNVSRRHARILRDNGAIQIEDLDSYNGIKINGTRIQGRADLGESDRVQIGDYLIELKDEAADDKGNQRTQPMERVDPMGNTPIPEKISEADTQAATQPVPAIAPVPPVEAKPAPAPAPPVTPPAPAYPQAPAGAVQALADTDPGLAAQTDAAASSQHARLVVLSSNFAGQEFSLNKPASVIGRTDDNDIVCNHRSISRHHAKIVREQGRYAIVDLQSSNGVRVNGEEYGKVELRRGDVIDLGHVRLRFVEAGEDFVLGRDAEIVDLAELGQRRGRGMMWAFLALLLVGGAVTVFMMSGGDGDQAAGRQPPVQPDPPDPTPDPTPDPIPDTPPDPVPDPVPDTPPGEDAKGYLKAAREAVDAENWSRAREMAEAALEIDPANVEAQKVKQQADREMANELQYEKFKQAVARKNYEGVASLFTKIDAGSIYRVKAQADHDRLRDEYVEQKSAEAAKLASAGNCKGLDALARRTERVWADAGSAVRAYSRQCKKAGGGDTGGGGGGTGGGTAGGGGTNGGGGGGTTGGGGGTTTTPTKSAAELVAEAREAYISNRYGKAFKLCEDALEINDRDANARQVCALAACKMNNSKKAKKHYDKLSASARRLVYTQCKQFGVELE